jgi:hypothetical protein
MARSLVNFDDLLAEPATKPATGGRVQMQPAKPRVSFDDLMPRLKSDDGKVMGSVVDGLQSLRLKREREELEKRNEQRRYDPTMVDSITGEVPQEIFDENAPGMNSGGMVLRDFARRYADEEVAKAAGRLDFRALDPMGVMTDTAREKLAARFKASLGDASDLTAYEYDDVGTANELLGQYAITDLQTARAKIQETFPGYGKDVDPQGLHPSKVIDRFRREKYPDLTYTEFMAGLGIKSAGETGGPVVMRDAEGPKATYGEALAETFRAALPRLATDIQVLSADIAGNEQARKDAMRLRETIQGSVADAQRGNDDTFMGKAGLAIAGSAPELLLGGAAGKVAGTAARAFTSYRAAKTAAATGAAFDTARVIKATERARNVASQAGFAATVLPSAYAEARAGGADAGTAAINALGNVAIEAIGESKFFEAASRVAKNYRDVSRNFATMVMGEAAGEAFVGAVQPLWNNATLGYDKPLEVGEYLEGIALGAVAGAGLGASVGSVDAATT